MWRQDINGKPVPDESGIAGEWDTYDQYGNLIEVDNFGPDGELALDRKTGLAGWKTKCDSHRKIVERWNLEVKRELIRDKDSNVAGWRSTYDDFGREIEHAFFGPDGNPAFNNDGYSRWRSEFDPRGLETKRCFFDMNDNLVFLKNEKYACWRATFDEHRNQIETAFFRLDGQRALNEDGVAGWRRKYDDRGNNIEETYFGLDGNSSLDGDGEAGLRDRFNERDELLERTNLGIDGKPHENKWGRLRELYEYDADGHEISRRFLNAAGNLVESNVSGRAEVKTVWDPRGFKVSETSLDRFEKPVTRKDEHWAVTKWIHDDNGELLKIVYLDANGKEVPAPGTSKP